MTETKKARKPRTKKPQDLCGKRLMVGSCLERLKDLPDESIDSVVTDPPYEIGFMGKGWDGAGVAYSVELWAECLRVLKPGGHLLAFGATRTYHRMAVAIEDAGFEIRDSIHWVYGSGFPKSLDVSKAIDKRGGNANLAAEIGAAIKQARLSRNWTIKQADAHFCGGTSNWSWFEGRPAGQRPPTSADFLTIAVEWVELAPLAAAVAEAEREVVGSDTKARSTAGKSALPTEGGTTIYETWDITAAATHAAKQWQGWGTALKPAHEPIVMARKPLTGTVAATVLTHGTGALNIDACRVGTETLPGHVRGKPSEGWQTAYEGGITPERTGRWPANIIVTHAASCALLPAGHTITEQKAGKVTDIRGGNYAQGVEAYKEREKLDRDVTSYKDTPAVWACAPDCPAALIDQQSNAEASRFFMQCDWDQAADAAPFLYQAKPGKKERNAGLDDLPKKPSGKYAQDEWTKANMGFSHDSQNFHPTVKPLALIRYLQRLVTPPGGTTLDPFMGSGTSAAAAILEGFDWKGCEMTADYLPIIKARVKWATKEKRKEQPKLPLQD